MKTSYYSSRCAFEFNVCMCASRVCTMRGSLCRGKGYTCACMDSCVDRYVYRASSALIDSCERLLRRRHTSKLSCKRVIMQRFRNCLRLVRVARLLRSTSKTLHCKRSPKSRLVACAKASARHADDPQNIACNVWRASYRSRESEVPTLAMRFTDLCRREKRGHCF